MLLTKYGTVRENHHSPCVFMSFPQFLIFCNFMQEYIFLQKTLFAFFLYDEVAVPPLPFTVAGQLGVFGHHAVRSTAVNRARGL